jgi:aminopeptidase 2
MMRYLVQRTFSGLSSEKDYQEIVEFFKDKDTSKYNLALAQVLDTIRAKIAWLEVILC